jgi:mannose-6-phosphate isomerase-like protein (cupin superfamily)
MMEHNKNRTNHELSPSLCSLMQSLFTSKTSNWDAKLESIRDPNLDLSKESFEALKERIYSHPEITPAPPASLSATESFFSDARGSIRRVNEDGRYLNYMETKKGFMRSGDMHKLTQFDLVLSGSIEVWIRRNFPQNPNDNTSESSEYDEKIVFGPGSFFSVPPHTPHLFNFLEESNIVEWWDGEYEAWFYRPYRSFLSTVTEQLLRASSSTE